MEKPEEILSAFMDDEIDSSELESLALMDSLQQDALLATWARYHLIRDALKNTLPVLPVSDIRLHSKKPSHSKESCPG